MNVENIITSIRSVKTMPQLNELRLETTEAMMSDPPNTFERVQQEFRKAKNRLRRIPLSERDW